MQTPTAESSRNVDDEDELGLNTLGLLLSHHKPEELEDIQEEDDEIKDDGRIEDSHPIVHQAHSISPTGGATSAGSWLQLILQDLQECIKGKCINGDLIISKLQEFKLVLDHCAAFYETAALLNAVEGSMIKTLPMILRKSRDLPRPNQQQQQQQLPKSRITLYEKRVDITMLVNSIFEAWISNSRVAAVLSELQPRSSHDKLLQLYQGSPCWNVTTCTPYTQPMPPISAISNTIRSASPSGVSIFEKGVFTRFIESMNIISLSPAFNLLVAPEDTPPMARTIGLDSLVHFRWCPLSFDFASSCISLYSAFSSRISTMSTTSGRFDDSTRKSRSLPKAFCDTDEIAAHWRRLQSTLKHEFYHKLIARHGLSEVWIESVTHGLHLYLYFAILICARASALQEAANMLRPHLAAVAEKMFESGLPVCAGSSRRLSWSKVQDPDRSTDVVDEPPSTVNTRTRSFSEASATASAVDMRTAAPQFNFPKKRVSPEQRPSAGSEIDKLFTEYPSGACLTSPRVLKMVQNLYMVCLQGNNVDPLLLWTLLSIYEANDSIVSNLKEYHTKDASPKTAEAKIDWLTKLALEGSSLLETRLGSNIFSSIANVVAGKVTHEQKAASLYHVLALRFESDTSSLLSQETKWIATLIRVVGDLALQSAVEFGVPLELVRKITTSNNSELNISKQSAVPLESLVEVKKRSDIAHKTNAVEKALPATIRDVRKLSKTVSEMSTSQESLVTQYSELEGKINQQEKQLISAMEGPVARHTNQIKSLMNRFDSMCADLRKLAGLTSTQFASLSNQLSDIRKQTGELKMNSENKSPSERRNIKSESTDKVSNYEERKVAVEQRKDTNEWTSPSRVQSANGLVSSHASEAVSVDALGGCCTSDNEPNGGGYDMSLRIQNELDSYKRLHETISSLSDRLNQLEVFIRQQQHPLLQTANVDDFITSRFTRMKSEIDLLREEQKRSLEDALLTLGGLTESVQTILSKRDHPSQMVGEILETTEMKVQKLLDFVDARLSRITASHTAAGLQHDVTALQSISAAMEERLRKAEFNARTAEVAVSGRLAELDRMVYRLEENVRVLEEDSNRIAGENIRSVSALRNETHELIAAMKKRLKQTYITELMLRVDDLETQFKSLVSRRLVVRPTSSAATDSQEIPDTQSISNDKRYYDLSQRFEILAERNTSINNSLQWELSDVRAELHNSIKEAAADFETFKNDVRREMRERDEEFNRMKLEIALLHDAISGVQGENQEAADKCDNRYNTIMEKLGNLANKRRLSIWNKSKQDEDEKSPQVPFQNYHHLQESNSPPPPIDGESMTMYLRTIPSSKKKSSHSNKMSGINSP